MKSFLALTAIFLPCLVAPAEIHKCKSPNGSITYTNGYCDTTQDELDIANRATKPTPKASEPRPPCKSDAKTIC